MGMNESFRDVASFAVEAAAEEAIVPSYSRIPGSKRRAGRSDNGSPGSLKRSPGSGSQSELFASSATNANNVGGEDLVESQTLPKWPAQQSKRCLLQGAA